LPTQDKQETVSIELLHLGRDISDDDATQEAKKRGYRLATPREVLTLGAKHPDLQRQFPIIAAPAGRGVLYLDEVAAERELCVAYIGSDWSDYCRFAVVREPVGDVYTVRVYCADSLEQMIGDGNYDFVHQDINAENFPIVGQGKQMVNVELWHPNKYFSNGDKVEAELEKSKPGYRFATLPELLALGAAQPELQRQFPIAAMGSIWPHAGYRYFAFLSRDDVKRFLDLYSFGSGFTGHWRFAVVRDP
jgi:hypothetical protein